MPSIAAHLRVLFDPPIFTGTGGGFLLGRAATDPFPVGWRGGPHRQGEWSLDARPPIGCIAGAKGKPNTSSCSTAALCRLRHGSVASRWLT